MPRTYRQLLTEQEAVVFGNVPRARIFKGTSGLRSTQRCQKTKYVRLRSAM
jgi:hypothetical protein